MEINEMIDLNEGEPMMGDVDDIFTGSFEAGMSDAQLICGIAAMEKKCSSKPMQQVRLRICDFRLQCLKNHLHISSYYKM